MSENIMLSISLVTRNSKDLVCKCIDSIYNNSKGISLEILLVDNGSTDGTKNLISKKYPQIILTKNKENLYFTKAHNQNLHKVKGEYFLVLNDDTLIHKGTLKKMINFMNNNPKVGIAGCRHLEASGKIEKAGTTFPSPLYEFYSLTFIGQAIRKLIKAKSIESLIKKTRYSSWNRITNKRIDSVSGTFFFGRSTLLNKVGYFDENLLLYFEEPDYCKRALKEGYISYHVASASITHLHTRTISKMSHFLKYKIAEADTLRYYLKYYGILWAAILWLALRPNWLYWKLSANKTINNANKNSLSNLPSRNRRRRNFTSLSS